MELKKDWRVETAEFIRGEKLRKKLYKAPTRDWDHDHCAACWAKFAEFEELGKLREGYATVADSKWGEDYHWVCPQCFKDLHEVLEWSEVQ